MSASSPTGRGKPFRRLADGLPIRHRGLSNQVALGFILPEITAVLCQKGSGVALGTVDRLANQPRGSQHVLRVRSGGGQGRLHEPLRFRGVDPRRGPLHFEPRLLEQHIDKEAIDQAFKELTGGLSDLDRHQLAQAAAKMAVLVKSPERVQKICADIARHFLEKVAPNGFGAQVGYVRSRELRAL